ncbi:hypothetical protein LZ32DRAFT_632321 [Colletotrichum eremochloae]|nr:hypothetical protein LZ32DRAFT_632321 [Colletotrichum eremochloae]
MEKSMGSSSEPSRYRAILLVLASQLMAAVLHALARLLETRSRFQERVHPFTVLQVRLLITSLGCSTYLWWKKTPSFPLGPSELRPLLALRAIGGILGACGFYVSMSYLSLNEATALNSLGPLGALILTRYLDMGKVVLTDGISCTVALASVVLVLQPSSVFGTATGMLARDVSLDSNAAIYGTLSGMVGVVGGIIALSAISRLGTRAHPLLTVNYFSCSVFVVTTFFSFFIPEVILPTTIGSWCLLVAVGIIGLCMEYLLTAGLGSDDSPSATVMIYSQVIWALLLDWLIWHPRVNMLTILGCIGLISTLRQWRYALD